MLKVAGGESARNCLTAPSIASRPTCRVPVGGVFEDAVVGDASSDGVDVVVDVVKRSSGAGADRLYSIHR